MTDWDRMLNIVYDNKVRACTNASHTHNCTQVHIQMQVCVCNLLTISMLRLTLGQERGNKLYVSRRRTVFQSAVLLLPL